MGRDMRLSQSSWHGQRQVVPPQHISIASSNGTEFRMKIGSCDSTDRYIGIYSMVWNEIEIPPEILSLRCQAMSKIHFTMSTAMHHQSVSI